MQLVLKSGSPLLATRPNIRFKLHRALWIMFLPIIGLNGSKTWQTIEHRKINHHIFLLSFPACFLYWFRMSFLLFLFSLHFQDSHIPCPHLCSFFLPSHLFNPNRMFVVFLLLFFPSFSVFPRVLSSYVLSSFPGHLCIDFEHFFCSSCSFCVFSVFPNLWEEPHSCWKVKWLWLPLCQKSSGFGRPSFSPSRFLLASSLSCSFSCAWSLLSLSLSPSLFLSLSLCSRFDLLLDFWLIFYHFVQVPMFTASGLHVRFLKVFEKCMRHIFFLIEITEFICFLFGLVFCFLTIYCFCLISFCLCSELSNYKVGAVHH